MNDLETDIEALENATRLFFQTVKRPQNWAHVQSRSGISIDRPSAVILQSLLITQGSSRVQDLADRLGIEAPSISRKTHELELAGYIRRVHDKDDKRVVDVHISAKGRSTAESLRKAQREVIAEALKDWTPSERRNLVKLFQRFSSDLASLTSKSNRAQPKRSRRA